MDLLIVQKVIMNMKMNVLIVLIIVYIVIMKTVIYANKDIILMEIIVPNVLIIV